MFSKQTLGKIFFFFTIILVVLPKFIRADDDDDMLGEIITDLFIGVAMGACETSATCSSFMSIVSIAIIIFTLIVCCVNGCRCDDEYRPNGRTFRRMGTAGVGYGIGRTIFR
tara:strand:+ start:593 stop:928 length:336 start_codon:yes stop_codon:yes gene_type:complete